MEINIYSEDEQKKQDNMQMAEVMFAEEVQLFSSKTKFHLYQEYVIIFKFSKKLHKSSSFSLIWTSKF